MIGRPRLKVQFWAPDSENNQLTKFRVRTFTNYMAIKKFKSILTFKGVASSFAEDLCEDIHELGAEKMLNDWTVKEVIDNYVKKNKVERYVAEQEFYSEVIKQLKKQL